MLNQLRSYYKYRLNQLYVWRIWKTNKWKCTIPEQVSVTNMLSIEMSLSNDEPRVAVNNNYTERNF